MKAFFRALPLAAILIAASTSASASGNGANWRTEPRIASIENLKAVSAGLTKRQVRELLGPPHFNEGIGAGTWHYKLDVRRENVSNGLSCVLGLDFAKRRVSKVSWNNDACMSPAKG